MISDLFVLCYPLVLEKYSLYEFVPLLNGIRTGNLMEFSDGLMKNQDLFIRRGTYLLLEKCKMICYRNLFKRIWKIVGTEKIKLDYIATSSINISKCFILNPTDCNFIKLFEFALHTGFLPVMLDLYCHRSWFCAQKSKESQIINFQNRNKLPCHEFCSYCAVTLNSNSWSWPWLNFILAAQSKRRWNVWLPGCV